MFHKLWSLGIPPKSRRREMSYQNPYILQQLPFGQFPQTVLPFPAPQVPKIQVVRLAWLQEGNFRSSFSFRRGREECSERGLTISSHCTSCSNSSRHCRRLPANHWLSSSAWLCSTAYCPYRSTGTVRTPVLAAICNETMPWSRTTIPVNLEISLTQPRN
jgi:hypothetical protein